MGMQEEVKKVYSLRELLDELDAASEEFERAFIRSTEASKEETVARNRLNNAQRSVDRCMELMRGEAPKSSDWGHMGIRKVPVRGAEPSRSCNE